MLVALADAVVAALNGATAGTFTTAFTAARKFAPLIDLKDAPDLTKTPAVSPLVLILPGSDDEDRQGGGPRASFLGDYAVDCVIYGRVGVGDAAEALCAMLMDLRQQIRSFLGKTLVPVSGIKASAGVVAKVDGDPAYGLETLVNTHCFVSAQTFTFKVPV